MCLVHRKLESSVRDGHTWGRTYGWSFLTETSTLCHHLKEDRMPNSEDLWLDLQKWLYSATNLRIHSMPTVPRKAEMTTNGGGTICFLDSDDSTGFIFWSVPSVILIEKARKFLAMKFSLMNLRCSFSLKLMQWGEGSFKEINGRHVLGVLLDLGNWTRKKEEQQVGVYI